MKRIGMVKVSGHSYFFGGLLNEFDVGRLKELGGGLAEIVMQDEEPKIPLGGAKVTHVWDYDRKKGEGFASAFGVEKVADSPTAMIGEVDAILLAETSEDGKDHASLALPFLEAGVPIFVDKPFSNNLRDARKMVEAAEKKGVPLMSSSLLRYNRAVEELHDEAEAIGDIRHIVASGPGNTLTYGVHACELMLAVSGGGVESIQNLGHKDLDLVCVEYSDGKTAVMQIFRNSPADFHITVYGSKGIRSKHLPVLTYRYGAAKMMQEFVKMIDSRQPPIPYTTTLEILKILLATQVSLSEGREVRLSEL